MIIAELKAFILQFYANVFLKLRESYEKGRVGRYEAKKMVRGNLFCFINF